MEGPLMPQMMLPFPVLFSASIEMKEVQRLFTELEIHVMIVCAAPVLDGGGDAFAVIIDCAGVPAAGIIHQLSNHHGCI